MNDELDPVERRLGDLFNQVSAPESMRRYETSSGLAPAPARWWSRPLGALFSAGGERRLRPLAAALVLPLLVLAVGGGLQLRAHFTGTAGPGANPPGRTGAAMAFDAGHGVVVMFGGMADPASGQLDLGDTWTWDGSSWTQQHPATSPSPRSNAAMGYDAAHGQVVLFGGDVRTMGSGDQQSRETWTWDGSNWHLVSTAHKPDDSGTAAMAFDGERNQLVMLTVVGGPQMMFGGSVSASGGGSAYGMAAPGAPSKILHPAPPPTQAPMPTSGCTVTASGGTCSGVFQSISGGLSQGGTAGVAQPVPHVVQASPMPAVPFVPMHPIQVVPTIQTWTWTGSDWQPHSPKGSPTGWPNQLSPAYDAAAKHLLLVSTDVVNVITMESTAECAVAKASSPQSTPIAVPLTCSPPPSSAYGHGPIHTPTPIAWAWDGSSWKPTEIGKGVPPAGGQRLSSDPTTGRVVGVGSGKTWSWSGSQWTTHPDPAALLGRTGFALADDTAHHVVVLFGGRRGGQLASDTWTWDGSTWTHRAGVVPPAPTQYIPQPVTIAPGCGPSLSSARNPDGSIDISLIGRPQGSASCPADTSGVVTLLDSAGVPAAITGNGFALDNLDLDILQWTNWCGPRPVSIVQLRMGKNTDTIGLGMSAACIDRSKPSVLAARSLSHVSPVVP